ncbi:MAG: hypothetical protein JWM80_6247 [Cyanobacteria bacterium RYN_339]|nr:hypothetical protein [Cyanobacteria bacterium RYN_339]
MRQVALALAILLAIAPGALAEGPSMKNEGPIMKSEGRFSQVAGIRIVPSILAHDVYLKPSAWMMRSGGSWANADARVYQNRDGAILGLTLTAWGLPEQIRYNENPKHYVAWLVDTPGHRMLNIGTLDANNMGRAMLGFSPLTPLAGYDRIVITQEPIIASTWPSSWQQLEADLPRAAVLPPPIDAPNRDMTAPDQRAPMDEHRGTTGSPL